LLAFTHVGTATALLEVEGVRLLTDPAFDPPERRYSFGWGTGSTKVKGPALSADSLGSIDAVLLSHDQHADNLDDAGRGLLPRAKLVLTTRPGARRLGGNARGLAEWEAFELATPSGRTLRITAVPARHGPPLSLPIVGKTIGFVLEWPGQTQGALYISGDTVFFGGIREIGRRYRIGTAILHLGGVRFPISGPLRYTFDGSGAERAIAALAPRTVVPVHYDGWTHFRESREKCERAFAAAGFGERVRWVEPGKRVELDV
jgi:L-ascorbate metabolism protein UlaG (beta-lactamase superfamily)